ncbi:hypothetical protein BT63DRAFT_474097 [Microthyrium microscopicum]|uniref:Uncharacterized protein n=1 Tax=Microthyrium microscopicum TaxID=703497 RepID=A0A6A6UTF2_9PEZI|nr:hypothetical protein BT63DRAFT_474097 [Microthyrium microscopicum]
MTAPTVTLADLQSFHLNHFPTAVVPEPAIESYEDDGLGHYPDGTKRTLTDEQVAIFRHSELQELLRKHRRAMENDELSEEGTPSTLESGSEKVQKPVNALKSAPIKTLLRSAPARSGKSKIAVTSEADLPEKSGQKQFYKPPKRKAKNFKGDGEERTFRRICREADEIKTETLELDY